MGIDDVTLEQIIHNFHLQRAQQAVFLFCPASMVDAGIKVVTPSLTALGVREGRGEGRGDTTKRKINYSRMVTFACVALR